MELTIAEINFLHILLSTIKSDGEHDLEKFSLEELLDSPFIESIIVKCKEQLILFQKSKGG